MDNLPISEWDDKRALDFIVSRCIGDRRKIRHLPSKGDFYELTVVSAPYLNDSAWAADVAREQQKQQQHIEAALREGAIGHSDHTVNGTERHRIKRIVDHVTAKEGRFTVKEARQVIKTREQLVVARHFYTGNMPPWLEELTTGVLSGRFKLTGGQCLTAGGIDLLGLFSELTERFKFKAPMVYQSMAEHLAINGYDSASPNNGYTPGAETVRQRIKKLKAQLNLKSNEG